MSLYTFRHKSLSIGFSKIKRLIICNKNRLFDNYNYNIIDSLYEHNKHTINKNGISLFSSPLFKSYIPRRFL